MTYISIRFQRDGLDEEHGVLESLDVRLELGCPGDTYHAFFLLRCNESHIWMYLYRNGCRRVNEEGDGAVLDRVYYFEFGVEMTLLML